MTDNDYIAQYIKERHPSLLGIDFALWKFVQKCKYAVRQISGVLATTPLGQLKKDTASAEDESDPETETDEEDGEDERNIETDKEE